MLTSNSGVVSKKYLPYKMSPFKVFTWFHVLSSLLSEDRSCNGISRDSGCSVGCVGLWLRELERKGLVKRYVRRGHRGGCSKTVYRGVNNFGLTVRGRKFINGCIRLKKLIDGVIRD